MQGLKVHMRLLLLEHYRRSGKQKPQVLIWYRDGVSEGQFPECSRVEVHPLQTAGAAVCYCSSRP